MQNPNHWNLVHVGAHIGPSEHSDMSFFTNTETSKVILIEPNPVAFEKLKENCKIHFPNNNFILLDKPISNSNNITKFYIPDIIPYSKESESFYKKENLPIWTDQLCSLHPEFFNYHKTQYPSLNKIPIKEIIVNPITLKEVFDTYQVKELDWLLIDAEGHDLEVLLSFSLKQIKPKKITIEVFHLSPKLAYNLINYLSTYGYTLTLAKDLDFHFELEN